MGGGVLIILASLPLMLHSEPRLADPVALTGATDILGESPVWSAAENALYWIDVRGRTLLRRGATDGAVRRWQMPELIGCFALTDSGRVLVGLERILGLFDLATGELEPLASPHRAGDRMRFNDGHCDRQGRFWVGSMNDATRAPVGWLYRLDGNGLTNVLDQVAVPNSLCWSPDGTTMYFADGIEPVIYAWDFDVRTGEIANRREFARVSTGIPDGATVDATGCLWSAIYGGSSVLRFAPDGTLRSEIPMPVTQPTCVAFGGSTLSTLYITSARQRLSDDALAAEPMAGAVFAIETEVAGLPEAPFRV